MEGCGCGMRMSEVLICCFVDDFNGVTCMINILSS